MDNFLVTLKKIWVEIKKKCYWNYCPGPSNKPCTTDQAAAEKLSVPLNKLPFNNPRFSCGQLVEKDCDMAKLFTGHKVTPERMWTIYQKLQKGIC